jgi:putative hemolysin
LEDIPETGEKFRWKYFAFEIIDMDKSRIDKILLEINEIIEPRD